MSVLATKVQTTAIVTGTVTIKAASSRVFWIQASNPGTPRVVQLINAASGSTPVLWEEQVFGIRLHRFDPPLEFPTALRVVFVGPGPTLTIGYE